METKTFAPVALVFGVLACTNGSLGGGDPGVGGTDGTGVGGTGGAGGWQLPGCIRALYEACAPQGSCTAAVNDAGMSSNVCFASGVRVAFTTTPSPSACLGIKTATVTKADGTPCYSYEAYASNGTQCETLNETWKDATGMIVATGTAYMLSQRISCTGGDGMTTCSSDSREVGSDPCCSITDLGIGECTVPTWGASCPPGACP